MPQNFRRGQAPQLQGPPPLQPAPIQSDTYTPPQVPTQDRRLAQLADALGNFNQSLVNFGMIKQQQQEKDSDLVAAGVINGMTQAEWSQAVRNGTIPAIDNPFVRLRVEYTAGELHAREWMNGIQNMVASGELDPLSTDFDAALTQLLGQELTSLDGAPASVRRGFVEATNNFRDWGIELQQQAVADQANTQRWNSISGEFALTFDSLLAQAGPGGTLDPEDVARAIHGMYPDLRTGYNVRNAALDQELLHWVSQIASTHPDVAQAILTVGRVDEAGNYVPPLGEKLDPATRAFVENIQGVIGTAFIDQAEDQLRSDLLANDVSLLVNNQSIQLLSDTTLTNPINGEQYTVTREQRIDAAIREYSRQLRDENPNRSSVTGDEWFTQMTTFIRNGEPVAELRDLLQGSLGQVNDSLFTDEQAINDFLGDFGPAAMAERLWTYNQNYFEGLVNERTYDFWATYMASRDAGDDSRTALSNALQAQNMDIEGIPMAAIRERVSATYGSIHAGYGIFGTGNARNAAQLQQEIVNEAERLWRAGLYTDPNRAVDAARDNVRDRSVFVNGFWVDTKGLTLPSNFEEIANDWIGFMWDRNKELWEGQGISRNELQFGHAGGGLFRLFVDNEPVFLNDNTTLEFTVRDILNYRILQDEIRQQEIIEQQNFQNTPMEPDPPAHEAEPVAAPAQPQPAPQPEPEPEPEPDPIEWNGTTQDDLLQGRVEPPRYAPGSPEWQEAQHILQERHPIDPAAGPEGLTRESTLAAMVALGLNRAGLINFLSAEYGWDILDIARRINSFSQ